MLFEAPYFPDIQGHTLPETKDRASETIKRVERAGWYPEPLLRPFQPPSGRRARQ